MEVVSRELASYELTARAKPRTRCRLPPKQVTARWAQQPHTEKQERYLSQINSLGNNLQIRYSINLPPWRPDFKIDFTSTQMSVCPA